MIPITTDIRLKSGLPKMTIGLILLMGLLEFGLKPLFADRYEFVQAFAFDMGPKGHWWGILTCSLIHANHWHYFGNMIFFWIFAAPLEDRLGPWKLLGLYFVTDIVASTLFAFMWTRWTGEWPPMSLGASGAVSGIMGLCAARFSKGRVKLWLGTTMALIFRRPFIAVPLPWLVAYFLFREIYYSYADFFETQIANWAHVGGFVGGLLCSKFLKLQNDDYSELLLADAKLSLEKGYLQEAGISFNRLQRMGKDSAEIREGIALAIGIPLRRQAAPRPGDMADASAKFEQAIGAFLKEDQPLKAIKLHRDWAPFFGYDRFALKFLPQLKSFDHLAAQENLRPNSEAERQSREADARKRLLAAKFNQDWREAFRQAQLLEGVSACESWDAETLLAAGLSASEMASASKMAGWLPLVVRKGDADQCLQALLGLEGLMARTPAQADLARYCVQAKNRWDYHLTDKQDWTDLQARLAKA